MVKNSPSVVPGFSMPTMANTCGMLSIMALRLSPSLGSYIAVIIEAYIVSTAINKSSSL